MPDEFPGNSGKPKFEKMVQGAERPQPVGKKFYHTFIQGHAKSVWQNVLWGTAVPRAKEALFDAQQEFFRGLLWNGTKGGSSRGSGGQSNYNDRYSPDRALRGREGERLSRTQRATFDFRDIEIPTRHEADQVLDTLAEAVDLYGSVSVSDFYTLVGYQTDPTDQRWGWDRIPRNNVIRRVRGRDGDDMFMIDLPRPKALED